MDSIVGTKVIGGYGVVWLTWDDGTTSPMYLERIKGDWIEISKKRYKEIREWSSQNS